MHATPSLIQTSPARGSAPLLPGPRNFVTTATLVARSALWREESRGAHHRVDFPRRDDARWRVHSVIRKGEGIGASETINFPAARGDETLAAPETRS